MKRVFIVGYMHSGTTLLQNLIARNEQLYVVPGETRFFEKEHLLRNQFGDLASEQGSTQFVEELGPRLARGLEQQVVDRAAQKIRLAVRDTPEAERLARGWRTLLDHIAEVTGKAGWVEKTPNHIHYLDAILRTCPSAKIIEIVRDPRDVLASKKTRRETVWTTDRYRPEERERKHLEKAYDPLWDAISWRSAIQAGNRTYRTHPEQIQRIRYEDLVAQPKQVVRQICEFLEITGDEDMLKVPPGNTAAWQERQDDTGIHVRSAGRWRKTLRSAEVALVQHVANKEMALLGYPPQRLKPDTHLHAGVLLSRSVMDLVLRFYRRWKLHGPAYVIHMLKNYLIQLRHLFGAGKA